MALSKITLTACFCLIAGSSFAAPKWDADGDGKMSLSEFTTARVERMMKGADKNGDGKITLDEWKARPAAAKAKGNPERRFERMDPNKDGSLDQAELTQFFDKRFARIDTDKDGTISKAERQAWRDARKG